MDLSVIIVNWNTRELLRQCLVSVVEATAGIEAGVLVVDNASTDGSADMVAEEFPAVTLIRNQENRGFVQGNNQAIEASRGRYVLLLNSDTIAPPESLARLVAFMDAHPETGAAGPQLLNADGSFQPSCAVYPTLLNESVQVLGLDKWLYRPYCPTPRGRSGEWNRAVDWVMGACLIVRREAVEAVGLLDPEYWMYSEETDWCYRIRQAGWRVYYVPDIEIVHLGGASSRQRRAEMVAQLYQSKLRFLSKHRGRVQAQAYRVVVVCASLAKAALAVGTRWVPAWRDESHARLKAAQATLRMAAGLGGAHGSDRA